MLTHLFKLIWNKKKQNFLIMLELFISFLVMFAVFVVIVKHYQSYNQPRGFDETDVWSIHRSTAQPLGMGDIASDSARLLDQLIIRQIRSMPEVQEVSYSSANTPYSNTRHSVQIKRGKVKARSDIFIVEDSYAGLMKIDLQAGRWFTKADFGTNYTPMVINTKLKEKLFEKEDALNKLISLGGRNYKVTGIVTNLKGEGDFVDADPGFFTRVDSLFYGKDNAILVKVRPGADANFEARLFKSLSRMMKSATWEIVHLDDKRALRNKQQILPLIIISIVVIFFIINVALGLFGVLWYNINKRRGEIGLRRAVGASGNNVSRQLVLEALVLSTISLLVGLFFAIQFPLLNIFDLPASIYFAGIVLAVVFIYLLVIICSLYPGKQAAAIYPATALHEE